ncbi:hypothetical protein B0H14DRAFT_3586237 [Mycena olivaceomarginata]|nr:hypothetical protein B0H14DRAFT_3586237 [Mycena olivaceomarginata]
MIASKLGFRPLPPQFPTLPPANKSCPERAAPSSPPGNRRPARVYITSPSPPHHPRPESAAPHPPPHHPCPPQIPAPSAPPGKSCPAANPRNPHPIIPCPISPPPLFASGQCRPAIMPMPPRLHVNTAPAHSHASPHIPRRIIPPPFLCLWSSPLLPPPGFPARQIPLSSGHLRFPTCPPPTLRSTPGRGSRGCAPSAFLSATPTSAAVPLSAPLPCGTAPSQQLCVYVARLCVSTRVRAATHVPSCPVAPLRHLPFPIPPHALLPLPATPVPFCLHLRLLLAPVSISTHRCRSASTSPESLISAAYSIASQPARSWKLDRSREMCSCPQSYSQCDIYCPISSNADLAVLVSARTHPTRFSSSILIAASLCHRALASLVLLADALVSEHPSHTCSVQMRIRISSWVRLGARAVPPGRKYYVCGAFEFAVCQRDIGAFFLPLFPYSPCGRVHLPHQYSRQLPRWHGSSSAVWEHSGAARLLSAATRSSSPVSTSAPSVRTRRRVNPNHTTSASLSCSPTYPRLQPYLCLQLYLPLLLRRTTSLPSRLASNPSPHI